MADPKELRIALFVDFENLVTNTGITPASFDLQPSIDRLLEKGKVIYRRGEVNETSKRGQALHSEAEVNVRSVP